MLKFHLLKGERFVIHFDIPLEDTIALPSEVKDFWNLLKNRGKCLFEYEENALVAISGEVNSLLTALSEVLPQEKTTEQRKMFKEILARNNVIDKEGLQVNFHQNPFDTPERYWRFIFNQGHFVDYFLNRINWFVAPQNEYVTSFPLHVDLESASTCNMNCPMCYRDGLKETGQMEMDLFQKAVDECAEHDVYSIRLSWRGETLTHPKIKEMISYATARIKNVSFLTNAFYLDEEMVRCFVESGVSYVAVSFDGIGETYEAIRHPAKFQENYQRLANLQAQKIKHKL